MAKEMSVEEWEQLRETIETLRTKKDRAIGARQQLRERLNSECGCKTVQAAQKKLIELEAIAEKAQQDANELMIKFMATRNRRIVDAD